MGKLAKAIVRSIESEPERWGESLLSLKRDDGVELRYGKPFADGTVCTAMLVKPLRVTFGIMDRWRLKAAVENWAASIVDQPGPLTERPDHES